MNRKYSPDRGRALDLSALAEARIAELYQEAEDLTRGLGLPPELLYDVLAVAHGAEPGIPPEPDFLVDFEAEHAHATTRSRYTRST